MNSTINKYNYNINTENNTIDIETKKSGNSKLQVSYVDPVTGKKHFSNNVEWNIPIKIKKVEIVNEDDAFSIRNIGDERIFHSRITFDDDSYLEDPIALEYSMTPFDTEGTYDPMDNRPLWGIQWDATSSLVEKKVIDKDGKRTFWIKTIKDTVENGTGDGTGIIDLVLHCNNTYKIPTLPPEDYAPSITFRARKKLCDLCIVDVIYDNDPVTKIYEENNPSKGGKGHFTVKYIYDDGSEEVVTDPLDITWNIESNNKEIVSFTGFDPVTNKFEITSNDSGLVEIYCQCEREGNIIKSNIISWKIDRTLTNIIINQSHSVQKIIDTDQILINTDYYFPVQKIYDNNPDKWDAWDDVGNNIIWSVKTKDGMDTTDATIETFMDSNFIVGKFRATVKGDYKIIATDANEGIIKGELIISTVKDIINIEIIPVNPNYGYYMNNTYNYNILITYEDGTTSNDVTKVNWTYSNNNAVTFTPKTFATTNDTMEMLLKSNTNGNIYAYDPRNNNNKSNFIVIDDAACIIKKIILRAKQGSSYYTSVPEKADVRSVNKTGTFDIVLKNNSGDCVHYGNPDMWDIETIGPITYTLDFPEDKNKAHLKRNILVTTTGTGSASLKIHFKYDGDGTIPILKNTYTLSWIIS